MEPISNASESLAVSPFEIPHEDIDALCASEGFQILRNYLAKDADFCAVHSNCEDQARETWLLHRDLLHALVMPVVELFRRASAMAEAALCTHKSEDLELAFAGDARSAFVWLQCFITEEEDWCRTRHCPACVTTETLSTESHIRLTIAASLLSTASIASPSSSANASPAASPTSSTATSPISEEPEQFNGTSLPPIPHILPALRSAISSDPFWGPDFWSYLFPRASQLSGNIQALITECVDLEALVSSPIEKPIARRCATNPASQFIVGGQAPEEKGVKLRKSKLAKRQLRMKGEEMDLLRRCALQCWAKAAVPNRVRGEILGLGREKRVRSLTCP